MRYHILKYMLVLVFALGLSMSANNMAYSAASEGGSEECGSQDFYDALAASESGGCGGGNQYNCMGPVISSGMHAGDRPLGKYQFMPKTLRGMGIDPNNFVGNGPAQEQAIRQFTADNDRCLERMGAYNHIGETKCGCTITRSGLLGAAHLGGCGGAANFAKGSGCGPSDQLGTSLGAYCQKFGGYDMFGSGPAPECGADVDIGGSPTEIFIGSQETITSPHEENLRWYLRNHFIASFMAMTEQFTVSMMQQMAMLGALIDAQIQMETQMVLQDLQAEAQKDYQPSTQMCVVGTNVRGLNNASEKAARNAHLLNTMLQDREILARDMATASTNTGIFDDMLSRIKQFKEKYCHEQENNDNMELMKCGSGSIQVTRDVNIMRNLDSKFTLDLDFTDTSLTPDEEDVIALGKYLFSNKPMKAIPPTYFADPDNPLIGDIGTENVMLDMRSLHAMRSVARHSFSSVVGMRGQSETKAAPFMARMMVSLGVPEDEATIFIGENPSYFAQMEVLTNKIYQTPDFFTNLYDTPSNLKRMRTTLKAIELMQDRDRYESALRREMLISLIVESKLRQHQNDVEERLFKTLGSESTNIE